MADQPDLKAYDHLQTLPRSMIAWEYLRRHPDYRRAWTKADRDRPRRTEIDDGTVLITVSRATPAAESWGLRGSGSRGRQRGAGKHRSDRLRALPQGRAQDR